jgi:polyisoprenoid-binding protein YceI
VTASKPRIAMAAYLIDKSTSRFTVRAFAGGMLSAMGHNPTIAIRAFTGEASFDPDVPADATLKLEVRADSLEVTDEISSKDRHEIESTMNAKVLESGKYPAITFESTGITAEKLGDGRYKVVLNGSLKLRDVTRDVPLTAQVNLNAGMLRASGEFSILQSAFGIPPVSVAGGALKLKDELKFTFDIVARKQE